MQSFVYMSRVADKLHNGQISDVLTVISDFKNQGKAGHEIQSSTLELINGLVSLVHQSTMPDVAQEAMEALLVLHNPEKIEVWNPEAPINTFWDVR
jgi:hypothetical protein